MIFDLHPLFYIYFKQDLSLEENYQGFYLIDVGCSRHIVHHSSRLLVNKRDVSEPIILLGGVRNVQKEGDLRSEEIAIDNVLSDPRFYINILSASSFVKNGFELKFARKASCILKDGQRIMHMFYTMTCFRMHIHLSLSDHFEGLELSEPGYVRDIIKLFRKDSAKEGTVASSQHSSEKSAVATEKIGNGKVWMLDSYGIPCHITCTKEGLTNIRKCPRIKYINLFTHCELIGDCKIGNLLLRDVLYCPNLELNSISILRLAAEQFECLITKKNATFKKNGEIYLTVPMVGNLWLYNSVHERNGWLESGCPHELDKILSFKKKHGDKFTIEEISEAFKSLAHECELIGLGTQFLPKKHWYTYFDRLDLFHAFLKLRDEFQESLSRGEA